MKYPRRPICRTGSMPSFGSSTSCSTRDTPRHPVRHSRGTIFQAKRSASAGCLFELLPEPEALGLLALMLLHDSRRAARTSPSGELILLDDQDRLLWNRDQIAEGLALVERALAARQVGPYTIQAAIAAVHANAPNSAATDWTQIVALYDLLARAEPSPVVELNRAVAVAMRDGPSAGLALIDAILGARRSFGLPPRPCGAGGSLQAAGANSGSPSFLRTGPEPHGAGAGTAISERRLAELG